MISYLQGPVIDSYDTSVVILTGGVGYEVFVTPRLMGTLLMKEGEEAGLYTYLQVSENGVALYGFASKSELTVFKHLITVSGIGPKGALAILSVFTVRELLSAVAHDDAKSISKAQGIGSKTASKMIIELKDKFRVLAASDEELKHADIREITEENTADDYSEIVDEAILALTALGYSRSDATRSVKAVEMTPEMTVEELIKRSLKARRTL